MAHPAPLVDHFGRTIRKLRISVTDRCNFRCMYCLPDGLASSGYAKSQILRFEEIERIARILVRMGVDHLRLTGGEPLLRSALPDLVGRLSSLTGAAGLALTTNGYALGRECAQLAESGLTGINVSLDSLRRGRFAIMSGMDALDRVRHGISAASEIGLATKINCVLIRGVNDDEVEDLATLARDNPYEVRFIEFMPSSGSLLWDRSRVVPSVEVLDRLSRLVPITEAGAHASGPARVYLPAGWAGKFGVIPAVTDPPCPSCDRLRLTADGHVLSCLYGRDRDNNLRDLLRAGATDSQVESLIRRVVSDKPIGSILWLKPEVAAPHLPHVEQDRLQPPLMCSVGG
ncbi:MAG: GTP 3',8-cyclase MoaA [Nitrospirae bacterium]|nr:GTP 3',8-cyclase MoaA [Nitrospirota bacterium]